MSAGYLTLYVIYDHPSDYPNHWVVRQHLVNGLWSSISAIGIVCNTLEEARAQIPPYLVCLPRVEDDDPVIVESWI